MSDYQQGAAAAPVSYAGGSQSVSTPAATQSQGINPYGSPSGSQSVYGPQHGDQRFGSNAPVYDPSSDVKPGSDPLQQLQQQPQGQHEQPAVGTTIPLMDGTAYVVTAESQQLNQQFHQSVEQHFGAGQFDAMVQFASTLSQGEQSSLERMVLSGDPATMQRAVQYVAQKMQGRGQNAQPVAQQPQQGYQPQPVGLSQQEFYQQLAQLEQAFNPGQREYTQFYQQLVQQRAAGKRAGR